MRTVKAHIKELIMAWVLAPGPHPWREAHSQTLHALSTVKRSRATGPTAATLWVLAAGRGPADDAHGHTALRPGVHYLAHAAT